MVWKRYGRKWSLCEHLCGGNEIGHTNLILDNQSLDQDFNAGKGKIVKQFLLQALTSPEGSRRLRLPDFMTVST
jgi:hypothetical protein